MRAAIVGAGPAGLTAARLLHSRGWDLQVYEARGWVGGRTHTAHFGEGHWLDTGAGWLASFYPRTRALLEAAGLSHLLSPMRLRGGGDLLIDGRIRPAPNSVNRILRTGLLSPAEKVRFLGWMAGLFAVQRPDLAIDLSYDAEDALDTLHGAGEPAIERIIRPNFEGPFFARLEEMSGTLVRAWLRSLSVGTFFHVDGGMDRPWRELAEPLPIHVDAPVEGVRLGGGGAAVSVRIGGEWDQFDAVVLAVPAPECLRILGESEPNLAADLGAVRYAPHVRAYVARRSSDPPPRSGVHLFPNRYAATLERGGSSPWGAVPSDWEWALVCAPSAHSGELLSLTDDQVLDALFDDANNRLGESIRWRDFELVQVVRWEHAVPIVDPGYYARLARIRQRPPILFAGDWRVQPCVEGAVRSAEMAVSALLGSPVTTRDLDPAQFR
jgi:predicted NAD/FAD-dependent oxidoreductase